MTRRPLDVVPQRKLVLRIRLLMDDLCAFDPCPCHHVGCLTARAELLRLAEENPRSMWSKKVTYNIGKERHARLRRAVEHEVVARKARAATSSISMRGTRRRLVGMTDNLSHRERMLTDE